MALIVKIMCASRGNDGHPRHGHRIFSDVREVEFEETDHENRTQPTVHLTFARETPGAPEETVTVPLRGNVYVMNEAGKTISTFEVDPEQSWAKLTDATAITSGGLAVGSISTRV